VELEQAEPLFDRSAEYERMLQQGLRFSGEGKDYFEHGRLRELDQALGRLGAPPPKRILDFGCGPGSTSRYLAEAFPSASVIGVDVSQQLIDRARREHCEAQDCPLGRDGHSRLGFELVEALDRLEPFDLCYVSGVFHHIAVKSRVLALDRIRRSLRPSGLFAFFENNPWNPGTRLVMSRIPFDRDAVTLSPSQARRLLISARFEITGPCRTLFYFPRLLSFLRPVEGLLGRVPLGAQYWYLATPRSVHES